MFQEEGKCHLSILNIEISFQKWSYKTAKLKKKLQLTFADTIIVPLKEARGIRYRRKISIYCYLLMPCSMDLEDRFKCHHNYLFAI